jgi:hypothetical protein
MSDTVDRRNAEREKVEHSRRLIEGAQPLRFSIVRTSNGVMMRETHCGSALIQSVPVE